MAAHDLMDRIVNLAKRRGLVFPSSEIYGGFRSTWDYGPLGVLLKRNVKDAWWRSMVQLRDDVVGLDAAILMAPRVWEASGHVATFTDPLVDCRNCNERFRADQLPASGACPNCGAKNSFTEARQFNLMFKTFVGPVEDDASVAYLRPETAQGIFVNFANVQTTTRKKPPFGIAQIGKSFRNEITPGNFVFRTREFEQMEMEYFVPPEDGPRWHEYWCAERFRWYTGLGIPDDMLRLRPHDAEELSHYSAGTSDVEFLYPWGWGELEGIANRTDFDLIQHAEFSGQDLSYYDQEHERRYVPHVIEPAAGADRATLAFLLAAYEEEEVANDKGGTDSRTVLHLHPRLAPVKVAVLPLSRNERLVPKADEVAALLRPRFMIDVDDAGSIGRRYRRQDEVGTPLCVTVDFDSLDDQAVTIRDRDTMSQDRVPIEKLIAELEGRLRAVTDDTYYDTLGVSKEATRDEMRAAYRARVEELEASREGKGVTDSALQANKEQTARVRAAWNVLSDPFQRDRYDAEIESGTGTGAGDDDSGDAAETAAPGTELTGWRRLIAPPPPRNGSAGKPAPARAANPRARTPTVVLPAGMTLADNRNRGMALLFDVSALLLIFILVQFAVPNLVQSDYSTTAKTITACNKVHDNSANAADKKKCGVSGDTRKARETAAQRKSDRLTKHIQTTGYVALVVSGVLMLLYLVPVAARTGKTIGMWRRNLRIVRVDGSRLTFGPALIRYGLPIALSLVLYPAMGQLAFVIGLFAVLWGFRDPNKQGIHDKLAKTLVVSAT